MRKYLQTVFTARRYASIGLPVPASAPYRAKFYKLLICFIVKLSDRLLPRKRKILSIGANKIKLKPLKLKTFRKITWSALP